MRVNGGVHDRAAGRRDSHAPAPRGFEDPSLVPRGRLRARTGTPRVPLPWAEHLERGGHAGGHAHPHAVPTTLALAQPAHAPERGAAAQGAARARRGRQARERAGRLSPSGLGRGLLRHAACRCSVARARGAGHGAAALAAASGAAVRAEGLATPAGAASHALRLRVCKRATRAVVHLQASARPSAAANGDGALWRRGQTESEGGCKHRDKRARKDDGDERRA